MTPGWVLWSGTVGFDSDVDERVAAAVAAGYHRISLSPHDVARGEASGRTARDRGARIRDAGLDVVLDPIMNWHDDRSAASADSPFARFTADHALRVAADLGAVAATAIAAIGPPVGPLDAVVEPFGRLADRAAGLGVRLDLEFVAASAVRTLAEAWHVVGSADRPGTGLVVDTWQFFRGEPDLAVLAAVPPAAVSAVQVSDGVPGRVPDLRADGRRRLVPGRGSFDLAGVLRVLAGSGALRWVGPEVIHPEQSAAGVSAALARADAPTRRLVDAARAAGRGPAPLPS